MEDTWTTALSTFSSTREKILEHRFIADVCAELWRRGHFDFAVSHSEVDNSGYDVILEVGKIIRLVQLKAAKAGGTTRDFGLQLRLRSKPSACAILMLHDPQTLAVTSWRFFGGAPGEQLPDLGYRIVRHNKGDSTGYKGERLALRRISMARFEPIADLANLVDCLFGDAALGVDGTAGDTPPTPTSS